MTPANAKKILLEERILNVATMTLYHPTEYVSFDAKDTEKLIRMDGTFSPDTLEAIALFMRNPEMFEEDLKPRSLGTCDFCAPCDNADLRNP